MKLGNWIPLDKSLAKHLPRDRPFSELEAMFSLSIDYDCEKDVTVSGYASRWGWSRKRVKSFLKRVGVEISYPENTSRKQNQKGQIALQIRNRSGTDQEQIRFIDSKWIDDKRNRSGTDKGQIRDRSGSATINPKNLNPNPKESAAYSEAFERWWKTYPKRNGRRVGKPAAYRMFLKIGKDDWGDLKTATDNYSRECGEFPKDAERFLRNDFWRDFLGKPQVCSKTEHTENRMSREELETFLREGIAATSNQEEFEAWLKPRCKRCWSIAYNHQQLFYEKQKPSNFRLFWERYNEDE